MRLDDLARLNAARAERRAALVVTRLRDGAQRVVPEEALADDPLAGTLRAMLASGKGGLVGMGGDEHFVAVHAPPVRIVAVGAVHISQAMAPLAAALGLDLIVIDPREAFATPERFRGVRLIAEWPDIALAGIAPDRRTAFAMLTHDPKIDDPALHAALRSDSFYVGALGSRKTHSRRVERLSGAGFDEAAIARIRAPIGLDIGAANPAEIALSILAEIVAAMRRPDATAEPQGAAAAAQGAGA